jgi:hypothetical protein
MVGKSSRDIHNPLAKELNSTSFAEVWQYLFGKFAKSIEFKLELLTEGNFLNIWQCGNNYKIPFRGF